MSRALLAWLLLTQPAQQPAPASATAPAPTAPAAQAALDQLFADQGIRIDRERGLLGLRCSVGVTRDLIEYLLVGPGGSGHESLLLTSATPSLINTGLLLLGVERGQDVRWVRREPPPSADELEQGAKPYRLELPQGDGFYLYVSWRRGRETFLFRVEDLLVDLRADTSMQRHRWVYTGSHFVRTKDGSERFAADVAENLISVVFFPERDVFTTAALPECVLQTNWVANAWLVPAAGSPVELLFARQPLTDLPAAWIDALPRVGPDPDRPAQIPADGPVPAGGGER